MDECTAWIKTAIYGYIERPAATVCQKTPTKRDPIIQTSEAPRVRCIRRESGGVLLEECFLVWVAYNQALHCMLYVPVHAKNTAQSHRAQRPKMLTTVSYIVYS